MPTETEGGWLSPRSSGRSSARAQGQRPLADPHVLLGRRRRHGQRGGVDLEQRQHAGLVGGDDLGDVAFLVAGHGDENGGRLVGEVEGAGDDEAVGGDDQPGGRADALADLLAVRPGGDQLGAAGGFDLDHAGRDLGDGGLGGLFLQVVEVLGGGRQSAQGNGGERQEGKSPGHGNGPLLGLGIAQLAWQPVAIHRIPTGLRTLGLLDHFGTVFIGSFKTISIVLSLSPRRTSSWTRLPGRSRLMMSLKFLTLPTCSPST